MKENKVSKEERELIIECLKADIKEKTDLTATQIAALEKYNPDYIASVENRVNNLNSLIARISEW